MTNSIWYALERKKASLLTIKAGLNCMKSNLEKQPKKYIVQEFLVQNPIG